MGPEPCRACPSPGGCSGRQGHCASAETFSAISSACADAGRTDGTEVAAAGTRLHGAGRAALPVPRWPGSAGAGGPNRAGGAFPACACSVLWAGEAPLSEPCFSRDGSRKLFDCPLRGDRPLAQASAVVGSGQVGHASGRPSTALVCLCRSTHCTGTFLTPCLLAGAGRCRAVPAGPVIWRAGLRPPGMVLSGWMGF